MDIGQLDSIAGEEGDPPQVPCSSLVSCGLQRPRVLQALDAQKNGWFNEEIVPVTVQSKGKASRQLPLVLPS